MIKIITFVALVIFTAAFQLKADSVYTVFTVYYPESKVMVGQKIYLRGDNCNMSWTKGL